MTAKEYLSQARLLDARINAKIQQVSALNDLATHATDVYKRQDPRLGGRAAAPSRRLCLRLLSERLR